VRMFYITLLIIFAAFKGKKLQGKGLLIPFLKKGDRGVGNDMKKNLPIIFFYSFKLIGHAMERIKYMVLIRSAPNPKSLPFREGI